MKEKLKTSDYKTKIQVLTLTPESWSRRRAAEFFEESEHSIRVARKLKEEKGIYQYLIHDMAKPFQKTLEKLL